MENFPYLCMIFPILLKIFPKPAYGNRRVNGKFPNANEKSLYVYGTLRTMEEKPYFRIWDIYDYFL